MIMDELKEEVPEEESTEFSEGASSIIDVSEGVYLSGPIRMVDDNGETWRNQLIEEYNDITFHNPLDNYNPAEVEILNDPYYLDPDSDKEQITPSEYVTEDKIMIERAEILLLGLPEVISRGSMMETMYAYMRGLPVFVWVLDGQEESGWIYNHAEMISSDIDEIMEVIQRW